MQRNDKMPLLPKNKRGNQPRYNQPPSPSPLWHDIERAEKLRKKVNSTKRTIKAQNICCTLAICTCPNAITIGGTITAFHFLVNKYNPESTKALHKKMQKKIDKANAIASNSPYSTVILEGVNETCREINPYTISLEKSLFSVPLPGEMKCYLAVSNKLNTFLNCNANTNCSVPFGSAENYYWCFEQYDNMLINMRTYHDFDCYDMSPGKAGTIAAGTVGIISSVVVLIVTAMCILFANSEHRSPRAIDELSKEDIGELSKLSKFDSSLSTQSTLFQLSNYLPEIEKQLQESEKIRVKKLFMLLSGCDKNKNPDSLLPDIVKLGVGPFQNLLFFSELVNQRIKRTDAEPEDDLGNEKFTV